MAKDNITVVKSVSETGRKESQELKVNRKRSTAFASTYANSAQISVSYFDFKLTFGTIESVDEKEVVIEEIVSVSMSPEHAGALAKILSHNIELYEKNFGSLRNLPTPN